jgi:pseudaminic acid biosynthesis-associated methylase
MNQIAAWRGAMGQAYTDRSPRDVETLNARYVAAYGIDAAELTGQFLGSLDRSMRVLECGANVGVQLQLLEAMGFTRLYGLDVQHYAATQAPCRFPYTQGTVLALPYPDRAFGLVFTSGLLIHVAPRDTPQALAEIRRVSARYIWGHEYYAPTFQAIPWRGCATALWKGDYSRMFCAQFPDLHIVRSRLLGHKTLKHLDTIYLLERV